MKDAISSHAEISESQIIPLSDYVMLSNVCTVAESHLKTSAHFMCYIQPLPGRRKRVGNRKKQQILGQKKRESREKRGQDDRYQKLTITAEHKMFYKDLRIPYSKTWTLLE